MIDRRRQRTLVTALSLFLGFVQVYLWSVDHGRSAIHAVLAAVFIGGGMYLLYHSLKQPRQ